MTDLRIIDERTVRALLPPQDAADAMVRALTGFDAGELYQHPRVVVDPAGDGGASGLALLMPAATTGGDRPLLGVKLLSLFPRARERELPRIQGLVLLMDAVHGEPLALLDATALTEIRTAAVSAVATEHLARPDARTLAVLGTGVQARGHLAALAQVRNWTSVRVHGRTEEGTRALAEWASHLGLPLETAATAAEAVEGADVICTVTSASEPVLPAGLPTSGVHINGVGAYGPECRELPSELVARASHFVENREAAAREAGNLLIPRREGFRVAEPVELAEVLTGRHPGRTGEEELTVFTSLGLPVEDVVACELIHRRSVDQDLGHLVRLSSPERPDERPGSAAPAPAARRAASTTDREAER
ncbi:ornithine cyclodeaminase family protein [Streptomyces bathyalis]|uniref:Ornithine cyclodeaminase family protein n=1 Tax=Streptomyces bathyalis TaxID=2710756 RepID=A0A7T1T8J3_9ACTN|nr:ornithine cyclodeaminase family protein [Streptomyces bathyalis]QPP08387.1 ornithine cyclodeaminase family protein [Streptomyces bathyalis]